MIKKKEYLKGRQDRYTKHGGRFADKKSSRSQFVSMKNEMENPKTLFSA